METASGTYEPLNTLKPVAADVWIVDGPLIRFGPKGLKMQFPTRMTVFRLTGGGLFVHSPTPLLPALGEEIRQAGRVNWIVGPNRLHYWWLPEWRSAFPEAQVYAAPRIEAQAGSRIDFPTLPLNYGTGYPWDDEILAVPVTGGYMTEVVFFHYASRTLLLTDLIENFEPGKVGSLLMRLLTRIGGVRDPDGGMPHDVRLTFRSHKPQLRAAVERMISLRPERILLAHGRWYPKGGAEELQRAFRWLLD